MLSHRWTGSSLPDLSSQLLFPFLYSVRCLIFKANSLCVWLNIGHIFCACLCRVGARYPAVIYLLGYPTKIQLSIPGSTIRKAHIEIKLALLTASFGVGRLHHPDLDRICECIESLINKADAVCRWCSLSEISRRPENTGVKSTIRDYSGQQRSNSAHFELGKLNQAPCKIVCFVQRKQ